MEGDMEMSDGNIKCSVDAFLMQTMPKMRVTLDYEEKDSNGFKLFVNIYHNGH
jgi:hypothetical protein